MNLTLVIVLLIILILVNIFNFNEKFGTSKKPPKSTNPYTNQSSTSPINELGIDVKCGQMYKGNLNNIQEKDLCPKECPGKQVGMEPPMVQCPILFDGIAL